MEFTLHICFGGLYISWDVSLLGKAFEGFVVCICTLGVILGCHIQSYIFLCLRRGLLGVVFISREELVNEFQKTTEEESKEEIVAHLANFAYDPYNYNFLRKLNVLDLFLDCLTEPNEKLVEFGLGGICNSCADTENAAVIIKNGGIPLIVSCLSSPVQNTVLSAIASLYYLCTPSADAEILTPQVIEAMRKYEDAKSVNIKFSNLAKAFLDKHVKS